MSRMIVVRRELFGEPKRFVDALTVHTRELLQQACGDEVSAPDGDGSFLITLHSHAGRAGLSKKVRVRISEARTVQSWVRIPIEWAAETTPHLFPTFEGGIELEHHDVSSVGLALTGMYSPPLGPIGAIVDSFGLQGQAQESAARLLNGLVGAMKDMVYGEAKGRPTPDPSQMLVARIATLKPLTIHEDTTLRAAATLLLLSGVSGLPVIDEDGHVVGVLSESDILDKVAVTIGFGSRARAAQRRHEAVTAGDACTRPALTTDVDTPVRAAATEMARRGVDRLVVMDGAEVAGILTRHDVLMVLVRPDEEVNDLVEAIIDRYEESSVDGRVEDGVLVLSGRASTRSRAGEIRRSVEAVDGLLDINSDGLDWDIDDVVPTSIPFM